MIAIAAPATHAQLPPLQSPPGWGRVPQGTGACSVEKTCADLAPGMIRNALGPSPLDRETRDLAEILSSHDSSVSRDAARWAFDAFHRAGADQVRAEAFGSPGGPDSVVAEIRGRDHPDDYVLIAAPLVETGTNPVAAAENAAVLVDAVRVIHASGSIPRRSIRFVLFATGAHNTTGRSASVWAYIRLHGADLDRIAAAAAIDATSGPLDGYSLEDRPETLSAVREALSPLQTLGIRKFTQAVLVPTVVTPFWLEGIPTLVATSSTPAESHRRVVSSPDNVALAEIDQLKRAVAIAAVTSYALADAEARIGPRRSRLEVEHSIHSGALEPKLKASGLWAQWHATRSDALR
ncbi:MAG: hypothetical protein WBQ34_06790 [Candidatus Acidiferrales bacterium]